MLPAADDAWVEGFVCTEACAWLEALTCECSFTFACPFALPWLDALTCECVFTFACPFALPWLDAVVPDDAVCECFTWPGAFAELPRVGCAPCCASCFCWPGAFPELPWPFPATALPLNAIAATTTASTPPRPLLGRCITSPRLWGLPWRGGPSSMRLVHVRIRF